MLRLGEEEIEHNKTTLNTVGHRSYGNIIRLLHHIVIKHMEVVSQHVILTD